MRLCEGSIGTVTQPMARLSEKRLELEAIYLLHSDTIYIQ